jgi:hypothetical protein
LTGLVGIKIFREICSVFLVMFSYILVFKSAGFHEGRFFTAPLSFKFKIFTSRLGNLRRFTLFSMGPIFLKLQYEHESRDFKHFEPNIKSSKSRRIV